MRRCFVLAASILTAVALCALTAPGTWAQDLPQPPVGFRPPPPPPPPPIKPYSAVTVKLAGPYSDPSFAAFRKELGTAVEKKDRAALAKLVVTQDFFWIQDKNLADASKPGIDNLARAIDLDNPNGAGWRVLAMDANEPTLAELPDNKGIFCAPAPPVFDAAAFEALVQQTDTDPEDWGYPARDGVEARAAAQPSATVIEKLGLYFVRVLPDSPKANPGETQFLHLALPDGKTGFIPIDALMPLATDKICYSKPGGAWKIMGYIGGVSP
jgi:hypothetical protein